MPLSWGPIWVSFGDIFQAIVVPNRFVSCFFDVTFRVPFFIDFRWNLGPKIDDFWTC